ncbi:MAG: hypothetical protein II845_10315 [Oscillospiraceae bacterium]|nr:hypothetical protein [Oscillospiraceae bacterium]
MNGIKKQQKRSGSAVKTVLLILAFLFMTGTVAFRYFQNPERKIQPILENQHEFTAEPAPPLLPQNVPEQTEIPSPEEPENKGRRSEPKTDEKQIPFQVSVIPEETRINGTEKEYTAETYQLVTDLVYTYRYLGAAGWPQVEDTLSSLKAVDPKLGELWDGIMRKWPMSVKNSL